MKVEISHDSLAKKIFSLIDVDEQMGLKVTQLIRRRYQDSLKTNSLLSEQALKYINPHLEYADLDEAEQQYVVRSQDAIRQKELRTRMYVFSVIALLALSVALTLIMYFRSERQSTAFNYISSAFDAFGYDRTLAFNLVEEGLRLDKNNALALSLRNDILIRSLRFPFYYDVIKEDDLQKISDMVVSDDKKYLIAGSLEGEIYIYSLEKGVKHGKRSSLVDTLVGAIHDVDIIGNSGFLTGGQDGVVRVWSFNKDKAGSGNVEVKLRHSFVHESPVYAVKMEEKEKDTLIYAVERTMILAWRLNDFTQRDTIPLPEVTNLEILDNEFLLTGGRDSMLRITDPKAGNPIDSMWVKDGAIENMDYNNEQLIVGLESGVLLIIDLSEKNLTQALEHAIEVEAHDDAIKDIIFSDDGSYILTSSRDKSAKLWYWSGNMKEAPILLNTFLGHEEGVRSVAMTKMGDNIRIIYTGGEDRTIKIWPLEIRETDRSEISGKNISAMAVRPDQGVFLAQNPDSLIRFSLLPVSSKGFYSEGWERSNRMNINKVLVSSSGSFFTVSERQIQYWREGVMGAFREFDERIYDVSIFSDGEQLLSCHQDEMVRWSDIENDTLRTRILKPQQKGLRKVAVSPDGKHILAAFQDNSLKLYELDTTEANTIKTVTMKPLPINRDKDTVIVNQHADDILNIGFSPDNRLFYSTGKDNSFVLYFFENPSDYSKGIEEIVPVRRHDADVNTLAFLLESPEAPARLQLPVYWKTDGSGAVQRSKKMLSASSDGTVRIWNADGLEEPSLISNDRPVMDAGFIDENRIVTRDDQGAVRVWDLSSMEDIKKQIFNYMEEGKDLSKMLKN